MGGACGTYRDRRGAYRIFVRRPERQRLVERIGHGWEDNIKMTLQKNRMEA
jgi:hypothetical protein